MPDPSRHLEALVDRQVRAWERARDEDPAGARRWPPIAVSRQYGALGAAVGRIVAARLGFGFWGQEVLHAIAEHTRAPLAMFLSLDERRQQEIQDLVGVAGGVTASDYLRELMRAVHTIADHGSAVIVGRGAHYILAPDAALRVRVVRALDRRIDHIADETGLTRVEAAAHVRATDEDRLEFSRYHFQRDDRDAADYDLVVNSGTMSLEAAAQIVIEGYRARFGGPPSPDRPAG